MAAPNAYEAARLAKIKKNQALLADLAIKTQSEFLPKALATKSRGIASSRGKGSDSNGEGDDGHDYGDARRTARKQRRSAYARTSARIAAAPKKQYYELNGLENGGVNGGAASQSRFRGSRTGRSTTGRSGADAVSDPAADRPQIERSASPSSFLPALSAEEIQANWKSWKPTALAPTRSASNATFHFPDHPDFTPNKSPEEMLRQGVFGGSYYRTLYSRKLRIEIKDDWKELPEEWLEHLDKERYLCNPNYDPEVNFFKVACGQSIEDWEAAGWIAHEFDVRGWFQWYTRFFRGRRCEDDERQVARWRKCVGPTGRWRRALLKKYLQAGVREVWDLGDEDDDDDGAGGGAKQVSPVVHQTCLHWAFEVRQEHLDEIWGQ